MAWNFKGSFPSDLVQGLNIYSRLMHLQAAAVLSSAEKVSSRELGAMDNFLKCEPVAM